MRDLESTADLAGKLPVHLLASADIAPPVARELFSFASKYDRAPSMNDKPYIVAILFSQPSTRTLLSFQSAALRSGAAIIGFSGVEASRGGDQYAESLDDIIRSAGQYAHVLVVRHFTAISSSSLDPGVGLINAGDGYNEHPTQALADVWSVLEAKPDVSRIGVLGTLGIRSVKSFLRLFSKFKEFELNIDHSEIDQIKGVFSDGIPNSINLKEHKNKTSLLESSEVIYCSGDRHPRFDVPLDRSPSKTVGKLLLTLDEYTGLKRRPFLLHPGPKTQDLGSQFDDLPTSLIWDQVRRALTVRAALLALYRHKLL